VIIVEKTSKLLSKVKISGGGRCNVTHACFDINEMSKNYPRGGNFVKKLFHHFFTIDTIQWFEERGVKLKKENDGRMFPITDSSQTIIDCLLREVNKSGIDVIINAEVKFVKSLNEKFELVFSDGKILTADYVCVASGGFSKISMFDWLRKLGHTIEEPVPSLFTFNIPHHPITKLMGISVDKVRVKIKGEKLEQVGPLLITHWGFSGPVILKLSAWAARLLKEKNWNFSININWLPEFNEQTLKVKFQQLRFEMATYKLFSKNPFDLPQRLWEFMLELSGIKKDLRWADLNSKDVNRFIHLLCDSEFEIKGKTTFKEEFVTAGGIKLNEIDHNTMMSKKVKNLFFAGEVLDVDGITGGYNFQYAWSSGFIAGKAIAGFSK